VSGVPVELRYFTVWSFRGNKLIRIENFRERGEALEAAGLSEYRPPSVVGLETRWKQRIAATREVAGSKPAAPIVRMAAGAGFFTPLASLLVRNQPRPSLFLVASRAFAALGVGRASCASHASRPAPRRSLP